MARRGGEPSERENGGAVELRAERLAKSFNGREVLREINLEVRRGEIVAIVGASGSGKTVLLDCLLRLLDVSGGKVLAADHGRRATPLIDITGAPERVLQRIRLHWAVVFQRNALFSGTVYDNIALLLREHFNMREAEIMRRARDSLAACSLDVDDVIRKDRDELSGGMAKRVAIARAIAIDPAVIFYDEPTTGLDPVVSGHIHELIWNMHHRPRAGGGQRTSVIVTHDKELLRRIRPRVVMLHKGVIVFDDEYEMFGISPSAPAQEYLREMPVLHGRRAQGGEGPMSPRH
ncbi:MAG TPA: ATP-binding cassette domain-containing protein [Phycisphaerales bacterium]|nr:ATP-binding cassette domain-containing protein [Phycisphaerales bacterium]